MEKLSRLTSEDRDNLPAYLDGELDEAQTRRIESLLVQNSVARNDVELLSKTYDLLDELERPDAPKDFVEKTLATAKLEQIKTPLSDQPWFQTTQKVGILLSWTVAFIIAAVAGFLITNRFVTDGSDKLVRELPVIQNLDRYDEVQSVEFLNQLTVEKALLEEMRKATSHAQK